MPPNGVAGSPLDLHETAERLGEIIGRDRLEHVAVGRMARRPAPLLNDAERLQRLRREPPPEAKSRHQIVSACQHRAK